MSSSSTDKVLSSSITISEETKVKESQEVVVEEIKEVTKEEPETKVLCTIEQVISSRKHSNADRLGVVRVLGYDVIVDPTSFGATMDTLDSLVGMKGVMFFVDAVIPAQLATQSCFSYLRDSHMGKRVNTIKLRGEYSQGLFLPFSTMKSFVDVDLSTLPVGENLTNVLKIQKYYAPDDVECPYLARITRTKGPGDPEKMAKMLLFPFPAQIPKTDQPHLQKKIDLFDKAGHRPVVLTLKIDGQSSTFYFDVSLKQGGMCSRNYGILVDEEGKNETNPQFIFVQQKYSILQKLEAECLKTNRNLAIQGEIYGNNINGNRLQLPGWDFRVFEIYEWESESIGVDEEGRQMYKGKYLPYAEAKEICNRLELPHAPELIPPTPFDKLLQKVGGTGEVGEIGEIDAWLAYAEKLRYDGLSPKKGLLAEGFVLKTTDGLLPYISCKVISRSFLAKYSL